MDTTPLPEKIGSFTGRKSDKKRDNANSNEPDSPTVDSKSDDHPTGEYQETEIAEESSSPNLHTSLPHVSEEIDGFINTLCDVNIDKSNPPEVPDSVENFSELVESMIARLDSGESKAKFEQNVEEHSDFVQAVNRMSKLTNALGEFPLTPALNRTGTVLQQAMSFLEEEFRTILEDSRSSNSDQKALSTKQSSFKSDDHESDRCVLPEAEPNGTEDFPSFSPEVVSNMNRIATAMISAGYETECFQVYSISRRSSFQEALKKLGFQNISIDDVQRMQWESLEGEIATWIKVVKNCATVLFSGERHFSESVFSEFPSISRGQFSNLASAVVIHLLNFAEAVAMTKRSAEKLFKFLDMYETLGDLIPAIDGMNLDEGADELKSEISFTAGRLGEAAICIFCDLENSIKSDTGKTPVPSGAVHPLTRYTMNYLKYACEYKDTLEQVFHQHTRIERPDVSDESDTADRGSSDQNGSDKTANPSPFSVQLMTVMELLDANLDAKSKLYRDPSLRYIFLMNNGRYILQKIKGSTEIHELMGDTWCRKRSWDLRQYHKSYQRETWSKMLGSLSHEGLQVNGKVVKPVLKERFKSFNATFDEIHRTQSTWVVSDERLQSELRISISAVVIPAYRSFLGRFGQYLDHGRQTEKYIKYQPEDIEASIEEFFEGNPTSMGRRRT